MNPWKVTWFDGSMMRETVVPPCDTYAVVSVANSHGISALSILKIERLAS